MLGSREKRILWFPGFSPLGRRRNDLNSLLGIAIRLHLVAIHTTVSSAKVMSCALPHVWSSWRAWHVVKNLRVEKSWHSFLLAWRTGREIREISLLYPSGAPY